MGKPVYIESFEIPESQDDINNNSAPPLVIPILFYRQWNFK
jgi:hypothetical protein